MVQTASILRESVSVQGSRTSWPKRLCWGMTRVSRRAAYIILLSGFMRCCLAPRSGNAVGRHVKQLSFYLSYTRCVRPQKGHRFTGRPIRDAILLSSSTASAELPAPLSWRKAHEAKIHFGRCHHAVAGVGVRLGPGRPFHRRRNRAAPSGARGARGHEQGSIRSRAWHVARLHCQLGGCLPRRRPRHLQLAFCRCSDRQRSLLRNGRMHAHEQGGLHRRRTGPPAQRRPLQERRRAEDGADVRRPLHRRHPSAAAHRRSAATPSTSSPSCTARVARSIAA
jgi:hypothetical protein